MKERSRSMLRSFATARNECRSIVAVVAFILSSVSSGTNWFVIFAQRRMISATAFTQWIEASSSHRIFGANIAYLYAALQMAAADYFVSSANVSSGMIPPLVHVVLPAVWLHQWC